MKLLIIGILAFLFSFSGNSQFSALLHRSDTLSKKRMHFVTTVSTVNWAVQTGLSYSIWYNEHPKSSFHLFDDSKEWLQMDKVGHFYSANKLSYIYSESYIWAGMKPKKAVIIGSLLGLGSLSTIEILDGFNAGWGFSLSDMAANTLGCLSYASQKLAWKDERFLLKFSVHPTKYAAIRPNVLGSTAVQRFLKDYNGQTYWVSFSPFSFMNNPKLPKWLCLSMGYSIDQKLVGSQDTYLDVSTNTLYKAKRTFLFSMDIDFSKLPIKRHWLKTIVRQLNYLKIPFPTLIFSDGKWTGNGLYF